MTDQQVKNVARVFLNWAYQEATWAIGDDERECLAFVRKLAQDRCPNDVERIVKAASQKYDRDSGYPRA